MEEKEENVVEDHPQDVAEEQPQEVVEGHPQEVEGHPQEVEGHPQEVEGHPHKMVEEQAQEVAEDQPQEVAEDQPQEVAEDQPQEVAEVQQQEVAEGQPQEGAPDEALGQDLETDAKEEDSVTELPTAIEGPEAGEESLFPESLAIHETTPPEDVELPPITGPPPMAPPPAIFVREDGLGTIGTEEDGRRKVTPADAKKTAGAKAVAPAYPFRARSRTEKEIEAELRKTPPRHDYHGFLFSSNTERPSGCFHNYFLPIYPQPQPKQHIKITGIPVRLSCVHNMADIPRDLLPLSTVKVTWSSARNRTVYRLEGLYAYLSRFGSIDGVYSKTVNSAYVIFSDLEAAKAAVTCPFLGEPWDRLNAFWVEPRMYNAGFYQKYAAIENAPIRIRI